MNRNGVWVLFGSLFIIGLIISSCERTQDIKDIASACKSTDYISAHNCLTEDIMIVDGVEKVRYLCNAEDNNGS